MLIFGRAPFLITTWPLEKTILWALPIFLANLQRTWRHSTPIYMYDLHVWFIHVWFTVFVKSLHLNSVASIWNRQHWNRAECVEFRMKPCRMRGVQTETMWNARSSDWNHAECAEFRLKPCGMRGVQIGSPTNYAAVSRVYQNDKYHRTNKCWNVSTFALRALTEFVIDSLPENIFTSSVFHHFPDLRYTYPFWSTTNSNLELSAVT